VNLISISEASKEIGDKILYKNISFGIDENDKAAVIGINGSGKSTLLKIIYGKDSFDSGNFARNKNMVCGYLEQNINYKEKHSIRDFIFDSENQRMKLLSSYFELQSLIASEKSQNLKFELKNLEILEEKMNALQVWRLESEAKEILFHLGIKDINKKMSELSGGMIKKVALARLLIEENNLILLDEPTNHLDITSIAWLEEYLCKTKKAVIIITHDRYFLDNVANHILEIDNRQINKYKGNYSYFLEKKELLAEIEQKTLDKHQKILTKELEWLGRMPKARGTKQKARIQQIEGRQNVVKNTVQNIKDKENINSFYSREQRLGKKILEVINISKSFDSMSILPSFSYEFKKKERIGVIGDNGAGKTTFLQILMRNIEPDTGKVNLGINTKIGYLSQATESLNESLSVIHAVKEIANYIEFEDGKKITAGQLLDKFLFKNHGQKVNRLSGGERRRLDIIRILMTNPNFLILDEPTNDLDLQTLALLEDYLTDFEGCLIIVSHDRYFLDKLTDTLFIFEKGNSVKIVPGLCSDYLFTEKKMRQNHQKAKKENKPERVKLKTKFSYKDRLRKEVIEKEIPDLENEIKELNKKLSSGETDHKLLEKWSYLHIEKEKQLFDLLAELEEIENSI